MGFSRQKYWSGLPFPPTGDLPNPGMEPASPESPALPGDSKPLSHQGTHPWAIQKGKNIWHQNMIPPTCPGQTVSSRLRGKSRGQLLIASERMKWLSQSRNDLQLWDVSGGESKLQCCKEHYYIGTWNVRSTIQGKWKVVKREMARVNINILGISELKWTGTGESNSDDHHIYYCGQESLRRNGVAIMCLEPAWGIPPMAKVMRKEADKTQRRDLASGVPPEFSWTSNPKNQSLPALLLCFSLFWHSLEKN